jgi:hypothetical protein
MRSTDPGTERPEVVQVVPSKSLLKKGRASFKVNHQKASSSFSLQTIHGGDEDNYHFNHRLVSFPPQQYHKF